MNKEISKAYEIGMNIKYSLAQGLYWMIYCCALSMASAFLSGKGYDTAKIGFILALVYLLGICIQQLVSVYVDKSTKINVLHIIVVLSVFMIVSLLFSAQTSQIGSLTTFWFMLGAILITVMQPFLNALNFYIEKTNVSMNFGVARGMGSFFFFIASLCAGELMHKYSVNAAPILGMVVTFVFLIDIFLIIFSLRDKKDNLKKAIVTEYNHNSDFSLNYIFEFIKKYSLFFLFLIGVIGFYYGHMVVNNFLYQIVVSVGGDESSNGFALALQAVVELPCMFLFTKLRDKFGTRLLLGVSGIFFFIKIIFTLIATTVPMLYFSMIFQSLSFALFIPASVTLVNEVMTEKDAVKGQAFVTISMTISNLIASIVTGLIIESYSTKVGLGVGAIVTFIGVVIAIFALFRIKTKNK